MYNEWKKGGVRKWERTKVVLEKVPVVDRWGDGPYTQDKVMLEFITTQSFILGVHYSLMYSFFSPQHDKCRFQHSHSSDFFWSCPGKNKSNPNVDYDSHRNYCLCWQ